MKWKIEFSQWTGPEVIATFRLHEDPQSALAGKWFEAPPQPLAAFAEHQLERLRLRLHRLYPGWNETELLAQFIVPVLMLVDFEGSDYNFFQERKLTAHLPQGKLSGNVDGMVARGISNPEVPYFFLHEYKKMKGSEADPRGQLLIALLAAQHLNDEGGPLYGCYIVGPYWRFVYLEGTTFAESQGYDASDAGELRIIWNILHETKRRIEARVTLTDRL